MAPDDGYTAGLKYVVPESGAYSVDIRYSGGSGGGLWDNKPSRLLEKIGLWRGKY